MVRRLQRRAEMMSALTKQALDSSVLTPVLQVLTY